MANVYVRSGATGTGTGANWANAYTSFIAAYTRAGAAAGDHYWLADDHDDTALTTTATTLTIKGTVAAPDWVVCVDRTVAGPAFTTADMRNTAKVGVTTNTLQITAGVLWCHGVNFSGSIGGTSASNISIGPYFGSFEECSFYIGSTNLSSAISFSNGVNLRNCSVGWAAASSQGIVNSSGFEWVNDPTWPVFIAGTTQPNFFISGSSGSPTNRSAITVSGLDISGFTGATLIGNIYQGFVRLRNCKLPSGISVYNPSNTVIVGAFIETINCNYGDTIRNERYSTCLSQLTETSITRVGGASNGISNYSIKFVPLGNIKKETAYPANDFVVWNDTVGSPVTLTVHLVSGQSLTDQDINLEVSYMGTAGQLLTTKITTDPGFLTGGTTLPTDTGQTWNNPPATPNYQKLVLTFTPQERGYIRWRPVVSRVFSNPCYVCPKADVT